MIGRDPPNRIRAPLTIARHILGRNSGSSNRSEIGIPTIQNLHHGHCASGDKAWDTNNKKLHPNITSTKKNYEKHWNPSSKHCMTTCGR